MSVHNRTGPNVQFECRPGSDPGAAHLESTIAGEAHHRDSRRLRQAKFLPSALDRRFADDVELLVARGPDAVAAVLIQVGDELGIRGSLETAVFHRLQCGRTPRLVWSRPRIHYGPKCLALDGPLSDTSLIIVDEASMIGPEMGRDLLAFGKPILVIGDPYQLPPIQSRGFFIRGKPDVLLTEIHRQAEGSPIIQMATIVRNGGWLRHGPRGASEVVPSVEPRARLNFDVVIAGLHRTRKLINREFRRMLGLEGPPQVGERVLCTRNSRPKGLMNGEVWTVCHVAGVHDGFVYMTVVDERQKLVDVRVLLDLFENDVAEQPDSMGEAFTWGYCLTCHKSQGSEWENVLVFDEGGAFRDPNDATQPNRWRYTGITRASDVVTVVRRRQ